MLGSSRSSLRVGAPGISAPASALSAASGNWQPTASRPAQSTPKRRVSKSAASRPLPVQAARASCSGGTAVGNGSPEAGAFREDSRQVVSYFCATHRIRTKPGLLREPDLVRSRSEEHTSELQSRGHLVCRLLLEKKKS